MTIKFCEFSSPHPASGGSLKCMLKEMITWTNFSYIALSGENNKKKLLNELKLTSTFWTLTGSLTFLLLTKFGSLCMMMTHIVLNGFGISIKL